jgi:hypothetical protein
VRQEAAGAADHRRRPHHQRRGLDDSAIGGGTRNTNAVSGGCFWGRINLDSGRQNGAKVRGS